MNIALVIIDMQNDFVLPEAPLCVKGAQATVPTIRKLLDRARAEGWRVIHGDRACAAVYPRGRHLRPRHQRRRDRRWAHAPAG